MMKNHKPKVAHFIRKNTQAKASFIRNQMASHDRYESMLIWRTSVSKPHDGGFAEFDYSPLGVLDLSKEESLWEKVLFNGPKVLSKKQIGSILKTLKKGEVEICHFHFGTDCGVFYPLLQYLEIPSVVSFYGYDCSSFPDFFNGYGRTYLSKRVFNDVTKVLAMSPDMKKDLIEAGCPEEKIIVHYYGTDCSRFYQKRDYPQKTTIKLLILASLVPQKGHLFLLKSLRKLLDQGISNWSLDIIGTGELEETLKAYIQKHGLTPFISMPGPITYASPEMMEAYRNADIFIHPSVIAENGDKEGIPGTIIEAMATGLPVISTYHAGIPFIINHLESGLLVQEWDTDDLAENISKLLADHKLRERIGKKGQSFALENLDLKSKEIELESIYDQVIESATLSLEFN
ncbi:MAG: colanic acid biosynthesis glycosyltransferase WcaL [Bacteroidetes bacterium]|nr:MAG: colanic acid biosynthesis glycosyltransferase WcaL [Bacteroidota bacterium]